MSAPVLDRRSFLALPVLATTPLAAQFDANRTPKNLRIEAVDVVVTNPDERPLGNYVLVKITTSEPGLYGWGDATCSGSEMAVATMLEEHLAPALIGRDPMQIGNLWQTLYHLPYYRSGSVHMSAMSGIDMALWDIKGKVAGLPVYELLGGKMRERLLTYRSAGGASIEEVEDGARALMERGYKVVKVQVAAPGAESGYAVPSSERVQAETQAAYDRGVPPSQLWEPEPYVRILPKLFAHLRKTVGDQVGLLHDVHERVTPSQAIRLAKALEEYDLFYLEDVLRPEHLDTYAIIRQQCSTPLAMGEVYTGAWEGLQLITDHLIDYARHDIAHVGGISTLRKVAALCEPYGIETAFHGPGNISPVSHMAHCHVSYSVPNFGIQEFAVGWGDGVRAVFSASPVFEDGYISIHDMPGLGIDVNEDEARKRPYKRRLRPTIRRADDTPWAY
ncbi:MAG: D-galactonate dehydratase family protein [Bryobacterales bacterium]|nr:D-galactonate dehydratase family protein [Bryobacterales bacterium]MDE0260856.1 D-galactonate dehydratase family protein [Bryobacterales bacterium]MDE0621578.1 D-galactonate dehydratase family protein [Bryobacterales bacterium]